MSDDAPQLIELETRFLTWHNSNGDLHLRTEGRLLYIDKKSTELVELAKRLPRGQRIRVEGRAIFSKTLSTHVLHLSEIETLLG